MYAQSFCAQWADQAWNTLTVEAKMFMIYRIEYKLGAVMGSLFIVLLGDPYFDSLNFIV